MYIRRTLVGSVAVCFLILALGTALRAQSLAEIAAREAKRRGTTEKKGPVVLVQDDRGGQHPTPRAAKESTNPDTGLTQGDQLTQKSADLLEKIQALERKMTEDVRTIGEVRQQLRLAEIDYKRSPKGIGTYDRVMALGDQVKRLAAEIRQNTVTNENLRGDVRVLDAQAKALKEAK